MTLIDYHPLGPIKRKLSWTVMKNLSMIKVDESALEPVKVHESFRPNESESLNSDQLSSLAQALGFLKILVLYEKLDPCISIMQCLTELGRGWQPEKIMKISQHCVLY